MDTEAQAPAVPPRDEDAARWRDLARSIKRWGLELGFADVAICDALPRDDDVLSARITEQRLQEWLDRGHHGTMEYMARHGMRRARPAELVPGTLSVIAVRMDYLPASTEDVEAGTASAIDSSTDATDATNATDATEATDAADAADAAEATEATEATDETDAADEADSADTRHDQPWIASSWAALRDPLHANVSRYAHGRDYHKVLRSRLQRLADRIVDAVGPLGHRVFTDSAPVMEVELARRAGLGWRGKHTLLLSRGGGSMFFLGELFVDVPLPADAPADDHCGSCARCIDVCPTQAIVAPHVLDARRCISYLTIEHAGPIPLEFRRAIGNRIYGCDDCQLVCPWNRFAKRSPLPDFDTRPLAHRTLLDVFAWSEADFLAHTEGSAIRRIGHERWLRNVAVALGNALADATSADCGLASADRDAIVDALRNRLVDSSTIVREHVEWALAQDAEVSARPQSTPAA